MCICYAQMMSAMLMFVLIALLVCAFIDEEQFLKTHYYTASKRLFMASMMYGAPAIGLLCRPKAPPPSPYPGPASALQRVGGVCAMVQGLQTL